jgi:ribonuclease Z
MAFEEARRGIKVAFCTDTRPVKIISEMASGADLMICEGMFAEDVKVCRAEETKHMTFEEAANLAKAASPDELWLTHFSPSLPDPYNYISVATKIFPKAVCGADGMYKEIKFRD